MFEAFQALPRETLITSIISAAAILSGSLVGGICSWIITNKSICRNEKIRTKLMEENLKHEENKRLKNICEYAVIIRLDICTALYQSIRYVKGSVSDKPLLFPIPINSAYASTIASLGDFFQLKELSYIYQLYGIIEKLNYDIKNLDYRDKHNMDLIESDYEMFIKKIYGENYKQILDIDIDRVSYEELYSNNSIKQGYGKVLRQLDDICIRNRQKQQD